MGEVAKERELWVHSYRMPPDSVTSIKMEVGIEDCLHIEFEYNKAKSVALSRSYHRVSSGRHWNCSADRLAGTT